MIKSKKARNDVDLALGCLDAAYFYASDTHEAYLPGKEDFCVRLANVTEKLQAKADGKHADYLANKLIDDIQSTILAWGDGCGLPTEQRKSIARKTLRLVLEGLAGDNDLGSSEPVPNSSGRKDPKVELGPTTGLSVEETQTQ